MNILIKMTILGMGFLFIGCKSDNQKFLENHRVILYHTNEANSFIKKAKIKPSEAKKIQANFAFKNNNKPEMYSFFIIDNYYVFTSYFQPKIPNASVKGIWVDAFTGEAKYVKKNIKLKYNKPFLEEDERFPF